jgi:hypothetical protein
MDNIPKNARTSALCGDHSNYTLEQAGENHLLNKIHVNAIDK